MTTKAYIFLKSSIPLFIIIFAMFLVYFLELGRVFSLETLREYRHLLKGFVESNPLLSPLIYVGIYIFVAALSIPGAIVLSLSGGFLFTQPYSTLYTVFGASLGSTAVFLAARTALGNCLQKRAGPLLSRMRLGFQKGAVNYLLFLRLIPIFPFWLVNLAPAFFSVPLRTFIWTTVVGITPGAFVFTQAGTALGSILDSKGVFSVEDLLNNDMKIALFALGIFSLLPILFKKVFKGHVDFEK